MSDERRLLRLPSAGHMHTLLLGLVALHHGHLVASSKGHFAILLNESAAQTPV